MNSQPISKVDRILSYYKGDVELLSFEEEEIRKCIDYADQLLREHNYDKHLVRNMLVQKFYCSIETARNYIRYAEIIHAAFMEININYEMMWLAEDLKKRLSMNKKDAKDHAKLAKVYLETLVELKKVQAEQIDLDKIRSGRRITITTSREALGLPANYDREAELLKAEELRKKAKKFLSGIAEEVNIIDDDATDE
jgi:hypothetical protein